MKKLACKQFAGFAQNKSLVVWYENGESDEFIGKVIEFGIKDKKGSIKEIVAKFDWLLRYRRVMKDDLGSWRISPIARSKSSGTIITISDPIVVSSNDHICICRSHDDQEITFSTNLIHIGQVWEIKNEYDSFET